MTFSQIAALVIFAGAYILIATERVHRVAAALGGAALMLALGFATERSAFYSADTGIDWNVIFLLMGMMVLVGILKQTGVFESLAIIAVKVARGRPYPLMVMLILITGTASAALDNVTTILLVAPVTFLVCDRLELDVTPYLIAEVMASNIGGTATLIGDPPNIIIGSRGNLTFNDFIANLAPFVLILLVAFVLLSRVMFRRAFVTKPDRIADVMSMSARSAITRPRLLAQSLAVLALVLAGFVLHTVLGFAPSIVALLGAGLLVLISRVRTAEAIADIEWETLVFFMGLFVMVGALVRTGVVGKLATALTGATGGDVWATALIILVGSLILSGLVDNIPYVATMAPLVAALTQVENGSHLTVLWWALALGADLGGNATAVGASANVVAIGIAQRRGNPISFWHFTRYGLVVTAMSGVLAIGYIYLRYVAFT